jgi:transcriptional regulator with XRE-family HTH domain
LTTWQLKTLKMEIFKRLRLFIEQNFLSTREFCELCNCDKSQICRYVNGVKQPSATILQKFYMAGLSIDWLFSGMGDMFASNEQGNILKNQHYQKGKDKNIEVINERIKQWISENFNTVDNFLVKSDISSVRLNKELTGTNLPTPEFMLCLSNAGCNIDWVLNGFGKEYSNNNEGFVLQTKKRIFSEDINGDKELQTEMLLMQVEERVKKVIRDEIDNNGRQ